MSTSQRVSYDPEGLNTAGDAAVIAATQITPVEHFFTRSHAAPPAIDPSSWRLRVHGLVDTPLSLSLSDLDEFTPHTVPATLLCAGIRRDELLRIAPLPGELPWGPQAAGTARWHGVRLRELLDEAGVRPGAQHVEFIGLDAVQRRGAVSGFGGSITIAKAREPDALIATGMNDAPLTEAHGAPARSIVPGWIGARSVKWISEIRVSAEPSANYFQTQAYRIEKTVRDDRPGDVSSGSAISVITLNSVILDPAPEAQVAAGPVTLRGWAIGSGGASLTTIECSADDGRTWHDATFEEGRGRWTWTRWHFTLQLAPGTHTLVVRATDGTGAEQPAQLQDVWNVKGYLNNAWHRIVVTAA